MEKMEMGKPIKIIENIDYISTNAKIIICSQKLLLKYCNFG